MRQSVSACLGVVLLMTAICAACIGADPPAEVSLGVGEVPDGAEPLDSVGPSDGEGPSDEGGPMDTGPSDVGLDALDAGPDGLPADGAIADGPTDVDADVLDAASLFCGDGIRGPLEECDDGLTDAGAARRTCSATCRVQEILAVAPPSGDAGLVAPGRLLGAGRHPIASDGTSLAIAFVEPVAKRAALTIFDARGAATDVVTPFTGGSTMALEAHPVVAPVGGNKWAVAWNDLDGDGDGLGVALRLVDPAAPTASAPAHANLTMSFAQRDPDILAVGSEIVVAWVDDSSVARGSDLKVRRFTKALVPIAGEEDLAATTDVETDVALAPFGSGWAAAWRAARGGLEAIQVKAGAASWSVGPFLPGPYGARPALVELDATHLLVVFAEGEDSGDATVGGYQLRYAILDTASPGATTSVSTGVSGALEVNAVRIGTRVYTLWRSAGVPGDAKAEELWIREVGWTGTELDLSKPTLTLARWAGHLGGDQRRAALASWGDAMGAGWNDYGLVFGLGQWTPDVVATRVPVPILRHETDGGL